MVKSRGTPLLLMKRCGLGQTIKILTKLKIGKDFSNRLETKLPKFNQKFISILAHFFAGNSFNLKTFINTH